MDPLSALHDRQSTGGALLRAVAQIPHDAPARLWADVANDPSYPTLHRNVAAYELFKRHLVKPSTLEQTASLLAGGLWLTDTAIEKIEAMGGEIPVRVPDVGSAFMIRFLPDPTASHPEIGLYLALDRDLTPTLLRDLLLGRTADPQLGQVHIVDFALFPEDLAEGGG